MDRPRRPEPIEPEDTSGQTPGPDSSAERSIPDAVDRQPDIEDPKPQETADRGDRPVEENSTPSAESSKDAPASRPDEAQVDRPDEPSTRPVRDGADSVDQRSLRDASSETTQPSDDPTLALPAAADRLPADLRAKMLEHPVFTRLGRGTDDQTELGDDVQNGVTPDDQAAVRTVEVDDRAPLEQPDVSVDEHAAASDAKDDLSADIEAADVVAVADGPEAREGTDLAGSGDVLEPVAEDGMPEALTTETPTRTDDSKPGTDLGNPPSETLAADVPEAIDQNIPTELPSSGIAERVAEHDKHWDTAEANLPPGPLPESAKDLDPEVLESLDPDIRLLLEYQGAGEYIAKNMEARPWLEPAKDASPAVQRIFAAIDQGTGHAHIRHGPMGTDQMYADRVAYLNDPAQTDVAKREAGVDGLDPTRLHRCGLQATRIHDAEAFVSAFAAAVKLPDVQAALATSVESKTDRPVAIRVPIAELLGDDGHKYCSGYELEGGREGAKARKEWAEARARGDDLSGLPEPRVRPIETFEGGYVVIAFHSNGKNYEINTLFVEPPSVDR
ncbi:hypothetical protein OG474_22595 [Kribbella sp. NBC_01505]|uniref:hypothetical protein n=1 Tax=Kribbella sp. NBC_01505 TaxID=2903580 RepID=UPI00386BA00A